MKKFLLIVTIVFCALIFVGCSQDLAYKTNLTNYYLNIVYSHETNSIDVSQIVDYINAEDTTLNQIKFHLYANAFKENSKASVVSLANHNSAYPNGVSYGNIQIKEVSIKEEQCTYLVEGEDENILTVSLKEELYPNDRVKIDILYTVNLANINHRLGYGNNAINLCNFYPIACVYENGDFVCDLYNSNGDPFFSEVANYCVSITYPKDYILASSGYKTSIQENEETVTQNLSAECVRYFGLVLSNNFQIKTCTYDERIKINYFYYGDKTPDETIKLINQVFAFFENKIGKYPYPEISVVETNFVHGGMEYPNLVLISDSVTDYSTYQMVVIHEICHQWWYGVVGNNQYKHGWIDEGLTEFCSIYFYDKHPEYNKTLSGMVNASTNNYVTFTRVYNSTLGSVDTSMNRSLNEFATEPEYVYNTYVKGMLLFATVYEVVGEKDFDKALAYYYKQNAYGTVTPEVVIKCFSKASGKNLTNLFNSWLMGNVVIVAK